MGKSDRGLGSIDVLPAGAAGPEHINLEFIRLNVDVDVFVNLRVNEYRSEGCMTPGISVEGRNTDQAMNANFRLELAVDVLPVYFDRRRFDTGAFAL